MSVSRPDGSYNQRVRLVERGGNYGTTAEIAHRTIAQALGAENKFSKKKDGGKKKKNTKIIFNSHDKRI